MLIWTVSCHLEVNSRARIFQERLSQDLIPQSVTQCLQGNISNHINHLTIFSYLVWFPGVQVHQDPQAKEAISRLILCITIMYTIITTITTIIILITLRWEPQQSGLSWKWLMKKSPEQHDSKPNLILYRSLSFLLEIWEKLLNNLLIHYSTLITMSFTSLSFI